MTVFIHIFRPVLWIELMEHLLDAILLPFHSIHTANPFDCGVSQTMIPYKNHKSIGIWNLKSVGILQVRAQFGSSLLVWQCFSSSYIQFFFFAFHFIQQLPGCIPTVSFSITPIPFDSTCRSNPFHPRTYTHIYNLSSSKLSCKYSGWKRFTWYVIKLKMLVNTRFSGGVYA